MGQSTGAWDRWRDVLRRAHAYAETPAEATRATWEHRRQDYARAILTWWAGADVGAGEVPLPSDGADHPEWTLATEAALRLAGAVADHLAGTGDREAVIGAIEAVRYAAERYAAERYAAERYAAVVAAEADHAA